MRLHVLNIVSQPNKIEAKHTLLTTDEDVAQQRKLFLFQMNL